MEKLNEEERHLLLQCVRRQMEVGMIHVSTARIRNLYNKLISNPVIHLDVERGIEQKEIDRILGEDS